MGVHSGKFGAINGMNMMRNWTLEDTSASQRIIHSGTKQGSFRQAGIKDWTGSFDLFHPKVADTSVLSAIMPGETFTFNGYTAPSDDQSGSTGVLYTGQAISESLVITWDFAGGTPPSIVCNFSSGMGTPLIIDPSGAFVEDPAPDVPETICVLKIERAPNSATPVYVPWPNITTATLTLSTDIQTYVNSSTNCNTGRKDGPIDWNLTLTEQEENQLAGSIATELHLRLYTEDTSGDGNPDVYWLLELGHLESYTGLTVDRETGAIIEKTANLMMNGYDAAADDYGRIALPGTTGPGPVWWGRDLT